MADVRAKHEEIMRTGAAAVAASSRYMTPVQRLEAVARGEGKVRADDLQALLAGRVAHAGRQIGILDRQAEDLLEMLVEPHIEDDTNLDCALQALERLSRLGRGYSSEIRRSAELLERMIRPRAPQLKVVASGQNVNLGAQQINNHLSRG